MDVFRCAVLFVCVWGTSSTSEPRFYPGEENWGEYGHVPSPPPEDICDLPIHSGNCWAHFPFYAFNKTSQKCEHFVYGGCGGNENQFETLEHCQRKCEPKDPVCTLKFETGHCRAAMVRFYFDTDTQTCKNAIYGRCGGNQNNFKTKDECEKMCLKDKELTELHNTQEQIYPLQNLFQGKSKCKQSRDILEIYPLPTPNPPSRDICRLPFHRGYCFAGFKNYFFNVTSERCESFIGCGGNDNQFGTEAECNQTCGTNKNGKQSRDILEIHPLPTPAPPSRDVCLLPFHRGNCYAMIESYFFNVTSQRCQKFFGCGGNDNRFGTEAECKQTCGTNKTGKQSGDIMEIHPLPTSVPPSRDVCRLPLDTVFCLTMIENYFFNVTSQRCEKFFGCGVNNNRFGTEAECNQTCGTNKTAESSPLAPPLPPPVQSSSLAQHPPPPAQAHFDSYPAGMEQLLLDDEAQQEGTSNS